MADEDTEGQRRILLFSQRELREELWRLAGYEFEDAVAAFDRATLVAPRRRSRFSLPLEQALHRSSHRLPITRRINPLLEVASVGDGYDLFFAYFQNAYDLVALASLPHWRRLAPTAACLVEEVWVRDIERWGAQLEVLSRFDVVFLYHHHSVAPLQRAIGRPCHYLPPAVDARLFSPVPQQPPRVIDMLGMGRRAAATHKALVDAMEKGSLFYLYDSARPRGVYDRHEHRLMLANLVKRSRYFLASRAKIDSDHQTGGQQEFGQRFFEGTAGGAVLIGDAPDNEQFRRCFDWPGALVPLDDPGAVVERIAELDADPERLARIRHHNVANSLRRHDWVHRWRQVLTTVGLPVTDSMLSRERELVLLAQMVDDEGSSALPGLSP